MRDRKVLLVHGRRPNFAMPGGGVEPGETPVANAERELFEETGLTARRIECLFVLETAINRHQVFLIETDGEIEKGPEINEFRWWDRKEALPIYSHVESILERL